MPSTKFDKEYFENYYGGNYAENLHRYLMSQAELDAVARLQGWPGIIPKAVFDIGAADGSLLHEMMMGGAETLDGVELSNAMHAKSKIICPRANIMCGSYTEALSPSNMVYGRSYDLMIGNIFMYLNDLEVVELLDLCSFRLSEKGVLMVGLTVNCGYNTKYILDKNNPSGLLVRDLRKDSDNSHSIKEYPRSKLWWVETLRKAGYEIIRFDNEIAYARRYHPNHPHLKQSPWGRVSENPVCTINGTSKFPRALMTTPDGMSRFTYKTVKVGKRSQSMWVEDGGLLKMTDRAFAHRASMVATLKAGFLGEGKEFRLRPTKTHRYLLGAIQFRQDDGTFVAVNDWYA